MPVATSIVTDIKARPEVAAKAVRRALRKIGNAPATSVFLFLTTEFARDPQSAIRAAAKVANCTQVIGCSATGIFTEDDWVLDAPAAAAMVFSGNINLHVARKKTNFPLLTIAAPNAINTTWLQRLGPSFGAVSGDATGQGPFSVWENGKGVVQGRCQIDMHGVKAAMAATHGLKLLNSPIPINAVNAYDVLVCGEMVAEVLLRQVYGAEDSETLPYHQLMAVYASSPELIHHEQYEQATIICSNEDGSITLSKALDKGMWLSWAVREQNTAMKQLTQVANQLDHQLDNAPDFGLFFSCMGRGPYFYNGVDKDLKILKKRFPQMPLIGFYGNGEFAPMNGKNVLLEYSAVLALFKEK